jgi:hypothetical protein
MSCPDQVTLEKVSGGLGPLPEPSHLETCPDCRARLARMQAEDEEFRRFVFPRTLDAVLASQERWTLRRWWPALAAAALAGLAVVLVPAAPPQDYLGAKGAALGLWVYTRDGSGATVQLADGAHVPASASLRFQVKPSRPCHLWLVSVDGAGQVSRLFPAVGEAPLVPAATQALPGGATLDGLGGPERVVALCTPSPLPLAQVEVAVREGAGELRPDWLSGVVRLEKVP